MFTSNMIFVNLFLIMFYIFQTSNVGASQTYIVYFGSHKHGSNPKESDIETASDSHINFLAFYLGSREKAKEAKIESYTRIINGFAAKIDPDVANEIRKNERVLSVFENKRKELQTNHVWEYLSEENNNMAPSNLLWKKANFGKDMIIGNLDTGVWPESQSFSDEGYGPIPARWKGKCCSDGDPTFSCNRKLIGARYYRTGFEDQVGEIDPSLCSPRDYDGHGTHTLSTAAGNFVSGVNFYDDSNMTVKGGAPWARVAAYKACWPGDGRNKVGGCSEIDILKAFDHAIYDGVDVIIGSLGLEPLEYLDDGVSIGAMHAIRHGIVVVSSAGNHGPSPGTVGNISPWIMSVGASTMDREFENHVELGNGFHLKGRSISKALHQQQPFPLMTGADAKFETASMEDALKCNTTAINFDKVEGKILVCTLAENEKLPYVKPVEISVLAAHYGAVGVIFCANENTPYVRKVYHHFIPTTDLNYKHSLALYGYMNSTNPVGSIRAPTQVMNTNRAPIMGAFSSRGPNIIQPEILKPDISAPGVNIVAAWSGAASPLRFGRNVDERVFAYVVASGTSMACPIVAGVAVLLKAIHPLWSPAAIKSAIMTTATPMDNTGQPISDASLAEATPFDYGAGHIRPELAAYPGLVYDLNIKDYLNFLCVLGYNQSTIQQFYTESYECPPYSEDISISNLNYPSITIPNLNNTTVVVNRKVTNVGAPSTYVANITAPIGVFVSVEPQVLEFEKDGDVKDFKLSLTATEERRKGCEFGSLVWLDGYHSVRSPITVCR